MCTSSMDGNIKVWDILGNGGSSPQLIGDKDMKQGELFSMQFCQDIPWVIACGGQKGELSVWDISENKTIEQHFKPYLIADSYNSEDYDANAVNADEYESMGEEDMEDE